MGFRENLKSELAYSGMLVKELAAQTGLKKHTIDNYLSVRGRMPSADAAVRIARALGVSVEYLVTGFEAPEKNKISDNSPEVRQIARTLKLLKPDHRKIALAFIEMLKKMESGTGKIPSS